MNYTLENTDSRDITFDGEMIAGVSSSPNQANETYYSGATGEWQTLRLYRTESGRYIAERINWTQWSNGRDRHEVEIITKSHGKTETDEIIAFFGTGWLAKELYAECNIDAAKKIA